MFYNIGSITLGLAAWIIAFVAICTGNRKSTCQVSSFICCCTSLLLQFYEIRRLMRMDDWIAVDDTINAICLAAGVLISVTVTLNLICEWRKLK